MAMRLTPYGSDGQACNLSKVGKGKTPESLAALMPSPGIAAKVGAQPEIAGTRAGRVVRRGAKG